MQRFLLLFTTSKGLLQVFDYKGIKGIKGIQIWAERGCARLSKLLRTDEAWDLWEEMNNVTKVNYHIKR
ncbi:hypothetical protein BMR02_15280 [Methylococcaceae bacterium HT1]|nr:hypothetical protein BMR02_15280 [Methylococcaceae bacterium HT1]